MPCAQRAAQLSLLVSRKSLRESLAFGLHPTQLKAQTVQLLRVLVIQKGIAFVPGGLQLLGAPVGV